MGKRWKGRRVLDGRRRPARQRQPEVPTAVHPSGVPQCGPPFRIMESFLFLSDLPTGHERDHAGSAGAPSFALSYGGPKPPPAGGPHGGVPQCGAPYLPGSWRATCSLRTCSRAMNAGCGRPRPQKLSDYQRAGTIPTLENFPAFCARGRAHPGGRFMGSAPSLPAKAGPGPTPQRLQRNGTPVRQTPACLICRSPRSSRMSRDWEKFASSLRSRWAFSLRFGPGFLVTARSFVLADFTGPFCGPPFGV